MNEVKALARSERRATAHLIASLGELDARKLYLGEGCSSLFTYCTQVLHLSEHAAYGRIEAARAARRFPLILEMLAEGTINLTTIGLLAAHLTGENVTDLLQRARHKSKRQVEEIVARLRPRPDVPSVVRRLPTPIQRALHTEARSSDQIVDSETATAPPTCDPVASRPRAVVAALAPERYKVQVTVSRETYDKLRRAQNLLRHVIPDGDPAQVFDRALTSLLAQLERTRLGASTRPAAAPTLSYASRHVPAAVRREVWTRDGGQCAFVGTEGRCSERGLLEFHHRVPFADGGQTSTENLELRCRAHNAYEAELWSGASESDFVREMADEYGISHREWH